MKLTKTEFIKELISGKKLQSPEMVDGEFVFFDGTNKGDPFKQYLDGEQHPMVWFNLPDEWKEYEEPIPDKHLCEFWDDSTHTRSLGFYDAKNSTKSNFVRFSCTGGERNGMAWINAKPIPRSQWPDWAVEAHKTLED